MGNKNQTIAIVLGCVLIAAVVVPGTVTGLDIEDGKLKFIELFGAFLGAILYGVFKQSDKPEEPPKEPEAKEGESSEG